MKSKILLLILILSLITLSYPVLQDSKTDNLIQYIVIPEPISIDGNVDFGLKATSNGWSGNGTFIDPYLIDGVSMTGNITTILLEIKNTDVYFVVQNSFFNNSYYGIWTTNVTNGLFFDNIFFQNTYGIYLSSSPNNIISRNTFLYNSWGLYPVYSDNTTIVMNSFNGNDFGVYHSRSDKAIISDNIFNGSSSAGLYFFRANYNSVIKNTFSNSNIGLQILNTIYNNVSYNQFNNNNNGIYGSSSSWNNLTGNEVYDNTYGIFFSYGNGNNITQNQIHKNSIGVMVDRQSTSYGDKSTNIWANIIYNNTDIGISVNFGNIARVYNNTVYQNQKGIRQYFGADHEIFNNNVFDNKYGIALESASYPKIWGHDLINNGFFINLYYDNLLYLKINSLENNTVNGKPVAYYNNTAGGVVSGDYGQIILANTTQMTVENNNIDAGSIGILLLKSSFINIERNSLGSNTQGIGVYASNNITINNNTITNSSESGIFVKNSDNTTITNNVLDMNFEGITGSFSDNVIINDNIIQYSLDDGVYFEQSDNLHFYSNLVYANGYDSMVIDRSIDSGIGLYSDFTDLNNQDNGISIFVMTNSVFEKNTFYDNKGFGFYASGGIGNDVHDNDFFDNRYPLNFTQVLNYTLSQMFIDSNYTINTYNNHFNNADLTDLDSDGQCDAGYEVLGTYENYETTCYSEPVGNHHILTRPRMKVSQSTDTFSNPTDGIYSVYSLSIKWNYGKDSLKHTVFHDLSIKSKDGNTVLVDTKDILYRDLTLTSQDMNIPSGDYVFTLRAYDNLGLERVTIKEFTLTNSISYTTTSSSSSTSTTTTSTTTTSPTTTSTRTPTNTDTNPSTTDDNISTKNDVLDTDKDTKKKNPFPYLPLIVSIIFIQFIRKRKFK